MGRRLRFWVLRYVPLVVLWLLFVDTFALQEVIVGLLAAAVAATAADLVRARDLVRFRIEGSWLLADALWRHLAALLRATGRIFLGWGPAEPAPTEAGDTAAATEGPEQEREIVAPRPRRLVTLLTPPAVLLAAALALGLVPGLTSQVEQAAARFTDREAYAGAVLESAAAPAPTAVRHEPGHLTVPALLSLASVLLGGGLALGALFRDRLPAGARGLLGRVWRPATAALRALHSGHIGDSVTWLVVGVAGLGALLAVAVR